MPLFVLAYRKLGRQFFWSTVICVTFQTVFLTFIKSPATPILEDPLTAALTGGIICGVGCGITLINGGSGGGQDILGMYISSNYHSFSVGKMSLIINVIVFAFCVAMYDITVVIYLLIYVAVYSYATDKMHAQNICTEVLTFTKNSVTVWGNYEKHLFSHK